MMDWHLMTPCSKGPTTSSLLKEARTAHKLCALKRFVPRYSKFTHPIVNQDIPMKVDLRNSLAGKGISLLAALLLLGTSQTAMADDGNGDSPNSDNPESTTDDPVFHRFPDLENASTLERLEEPLFVTRLVDSLALWPGNRSSGAPRSTRHRRSPDRSRRPRRRDPGPHRSRADRIGISTPQTSGRLVCSPCRPGTPLTNSHTSAQTMIRFVTPVRIIATAIAASNRDITFPKAREIPGCTHLVTTS